MAASFGRSFKPSYLSPSRMVRPGKPRRTLSNSSDMSSASASSSTSRAEDPFIFSAGNTPANEEPPALSASSATPTASAAAVTHDGTFRPAPSATPGHLGRAESESARLKRTRPIAIEIPVLRKVNTAPTHTPPEPLSARGDIPGGYFPLHEDPKSRVHRPHPFHADVTRARQHSITKAVESSHSTPPSQQALSVSSRTMSDQLPPLDAMNSASSRANTPVSSYIPSGFHENAMPLGKYYPSNYEKRSRSSSSQPRSSATPTPSTSQGSMKSEALSTRNRTTSSLSRSDSDAKRRLQQYQRDMIAQATLAASQVLVSADRAHGTALVANSAKLGAPVQSLQLGTTIMKSAKPISPKLQPLGSPGPVTPMDLEGVGDSYMNLGRSTSSQADELARVVRAGEEQRRREQATSSWTGLSSR